MRRSETTFLESMCMFYKAVIVVFDKVYLRKPNIVDTNIDQQVKRVGFLRCLKE